MIVVVAANASRPSPVIKPQKMVIAKSSDDGNLTILIIQVPPNHSAPNSLTTNNSALHNNLISQNFYCDQPLMSHKNDARLHHAHTLGPVSLLFGREPIFNPKWFNQPSMRFTACPKSLCKDAPTRARWAVYFRQSSDNGSSVGTLNASR